MYHSCFSHSSVVVTHSLKVSVPFCFFFWTYTPTCWLTQPSWNPLIPAASAPGRASKPGTSQALLLESLSDENSGFFALDHPSTAQESGEFLLETLRHHQGPWCKGGTWVELITRRVQGSPPGTRMLPTPSDPRFFLSHLKIVDSKTP